MRRRDGGGHLGWATTSAVVAGILEHKRGVWAGRLIWTALWSRAAQGRTPVPWQDFLIVARALQQDTPLAQIPLMGSVALRTVQSAWRWARAGERP